MDIETIKHYFNVIPDRRQSAKVDYPLFDLLFGTLCSVIAGGNGWTDIREYVLGHHDWFLKQGLFKKGVPVDDTFARLIGTIDPKAFRACFLSWMRAVHTLTEGEVVAIDGKTLRGSYTRDDRYSAIHMISAYASANHLVLGQMKTEQKSNEITALPHLIKLLDLREALVTIDAMGCQKSIAEAILAQGGDYLFAVKGNQGQLDKAIRDAFSDLRERPLNRESCAFEQKHGRIESRTCFRRDAEQLKGDFSGWKGLKTILMIESFRGVKGHPPTCEQRYYIPSKALTAQQANAAVRAHWGIESMHWILDVSFQEDACQIARENAAENLGGVRHMAFNMLKAESTAISIPRKQKRCTMQPAFLERVLCAGFNALANE